MKNAKSIFYCTECGNETPRWQGQCPACGSWNSIVEKTVSKSASGAAGRDRERSGRNAPARLSAVSAELEPRFSTGIGELDRVLGGGAVLGSVILVGGNPGIGKSTLMLQVCSQMGKFAKVLYVTGEESITQVKMRAERLGAEAPELYILAETVLDDIIESAGGLSPDVLVIDSVQTLYSGDVTSSPGSVSQVRECAAQLVRLAKEKGITVFLIGHVNKEGAIAGPKVLEHMVDCVLYFEGERDLAYRILRSAKNRYGSTNEIGVFEMLSDGLREVDNPSEMLISGRPLNTPGSCVTCVMEGSRPLLAEIQALLAKSSYNVPRRTANGVDYNRAMLLMAVVERRGGLEVSGCDAYINVTGGISLNEPGADLATVLAIASSLKDKPLPDDLVALGEIGLTGEIRPVNAVEQRLAEISRLGFRKCILPYKGRGKYAAAGQLELIPVKTVREALKAVF